jgi:hypothetical protein
LYILRDFWILGKFLIRHSVFLLPSGCPQRCYGPALLWLDDKVSQLDLSLFLISWQMWPRLTQPISFHTWPIRCALRLRNEAWQLPYQCDPASVIFACHFETAKRELAAPVWVRPLLISV